MYMSDNKSNSSALMGIKHDHDVAFTFTMRFGFGLSLYSMGCKNMRILSLRWLSPPMRNLVLGIPTCWYLKTLKFALPPTQILKFALPPTRNPNTSQLNIGCFGSQTQSFRIGHVHIIFLGVEFICVGSRFSVEYGL